MPARRSKTGNARGWTAEALLTLSPRMRLFAGAALISLSPVWVQLSDVAPTTSGFYRVAIGGVALTAYLLLRGERIAFSRPELRLLLLAAVFFALDLWFWHRSIRYVGPGLATLLANFQVFLLMFAGFAWYGQRPRPAQWIAVPLAITGLAMIVGLNWTDLPGDYRLGIGFGLLTALAYGSYLLAIRVLRAGAAGQRSTVVDIAMMSLVVTAMLGLSAAVENVSLAIPSVSDAGWLVAYGVLSHGLGTILIASALPEVTTTEAGLALLLQPGLSFAWDVLLFDRPYTGVQLAGAVLALLAIGLGGRARSGTV